MLRIILSSVACQASTHFFYIITQTARFSENKSLLNTICVSIFSTDFLWHFSHSKNNTVRYISVNVHLLLSSDVNKHLVFSTDFRKIFIYKISWKSVQWDPSCSFGQTDVTKLTVAFRNFANTPKSPRSANRLCLRVIYGSTSKQTAIISVYRTAPCNRDWECLLRGPNRIFI